MQATVGARRENKLAALFHNIKVNNATNACRKEAKRRNGKTKAFATDEAVIQLLDRTVIKGLSRALTVAEGQQHARRLKKAVYNECHDHGNAKTDHCLDQIS